MAMAAEKIERFTKTQLKERGWTDSSIKKFLGECNYSYPSPYTKKINVQLWNCDRVEEVEESEEFKQWHEKSKVKREKLSQSQSNVMEAKRSELREYINNLEVDVPVIPFEKLVMWACQHYNDRKEDSALSRSEYIPIPKDQLASLKSDPSFLYRICKNFIRHQMTDYEKELAGFFGKVGKQEGYELLKEKIMNEIDAKYSGLWEFVVSLSDR